MVCNNCGTQLKDGLKFCINCGAPVKAETAPAEAVETETVLSEPFPPAESASRLFDIIAAKNEELARINAEKERLTRERNTANQENRRLKQKSGRTKAGLIAAVVCALIGIGVCWFVWQDRYSAMESRYYYSNSQYNSLNATHEKSKAVWMIDIRDLAIVNAASGGRRLTNPGERLSARDMRFLTPVITFNSNVSGTVTVYVKIKKPDGTVFNNASTSPEGYTNSTALRVNYGKDQTLSLLGWGNSDNSVYPPGQYTVEVWLNNFLLASQSVTLY